MFSLGIQYDDDGLKIRYGQSSNPDARESLEADLLIGCDGIASIVRQWLSDDSSHSKVKSFDPTKYDPIRYNSPAVGLLYKILTINSNFTLPAQANESEPQRAIQEQGYVIR
jgi:hypothetical protein